MTSLVDETVFHEVLTPFGGKQHRYKFKNGWGASVVCHQYSYGGPAGLWELAVVDSDDALNYDTPITDDVIGFLEQSEVADILVKIAELPQCPLASNKGLPSGENAEAAIESMTSMIEDGVV